MNYIHVYSSAEFQYVKVQEHTVESHFLIYKADTK